MSSSTIRCYTSNYLLRRVFVQRAAKVPVPAFFTPAQAFGAYTATRRAVQHKTTIFFKMAGSIGRPVGSAKKTILRLHGQEGSGLTG